jgi:hypothetical protein
LDPATEFGITNTRYLKEIHPFLGNLREDPRFPGLMAKASDLSDRISKLVDIGELV